MKYLDKLILDCERAKNTKPIKKYIITTFDEVPDIKNGIYIFREIGGRAEDTFNSFVNFKQKKLKACCKVNEPSNIMYVGSSITGLKKRLKQHIVECADKTYSLRLYEWFKGEYEVQILQFNENEPKEVIQLIEDSISYDLSPAFGKQGGNNK